MNTKLYICLQLHKHTYDQYVWLHQNQYIQAWKSDWSSDFPPCGISLAPVARLDQMIRNLFGTNFQAKRGTHLVSYHH